MALGAVGRFGRDRLHAVLRHQLHLHRPRGGGRLPCRAVQHRRRRPGLYRAASAARSSILALDAYLPGIVLIPLALLASMAFGAAWALIPAYLQAYRGSHIVITTIMFNFIAASLMVYLGVERIAPAGRHGCREPRASPPPPICRMCTTSPRWLGIKMPSDAAQSVASCGRRSAACSCGCSSGAPRWGYAHPRRRPVAEGRGLCRHLAAARDHDRHVPVRRAGGRRRAQRDHRLSPSHAAGFRRRAPASPASRWR